MSNKCSKCDENENECKCDVDGVADVLQKVGAIYGGIGTAVAGIAIGVGTGGVGFLASGALVSAGISSTINGVKHAVNGTRINGTEFATDVTIGAITGAVTGGSSALAEGAAQQVTKQVLLRGASKLAVRATAGAAAGVVNKGITDICATNKDNVDDSLSSYCVAALQGAIGGAGSHISSNATKNMNFQSGLQGVAKGATRSSVASGTAVVSESARMYCSGEEMDTGRIIKSGLIAAGTTGGMELGKNGTYAYYGGKYNMINAKAIDNCNDTEISQEDKKEVKKVSRKANKIKHKKLKENQQKAQKFSEDMKDYQQALSTHQESLQALENESKCLNDQIQHNRAEIQQLSEQGNRGSQEYRRLIAEQQATCKDLKSCNRQIRAKRQQPPQQPSRPCNFMNDDNAHCLVDQPDQKPHLNQVSVDIGGSTNGSRSSRRAVFDIVDRKGNRTHLQISGYTSNHDYNAIPSYGDSKMVTPIQQQMTASNRRFNTFEMYQASRNHGSH